MDSGPRVQSANAEAAKRASHRAGRKGNSVVASGQPALATAIDLHPCTATQPPPRCATSPMTCTRINREYKSWPRAVSQTDVFHTHNLPSFDPLRLFHLEHLLASAPAWIASSHSHTTTQPRQSPSAAVAGVVFQHSGTRNRIPIGSTLLLLRRLTHLPRARPLALLFRPLLFYPPHLSKSSRLHPSSPWHKQWESTRQTSCSRSI